ncbi:MAG: MMPL family transporter [Planctomycetales bacterium]|nr:MMPL family transporter [Planctomycetales bacterium]
MLHALRAIETWSKRIAICIAILIPWMIYGAFNVRSGKASVHDWLPQSRPERITYDSFEAQFGNDQFILVSWSGATLKDPRLSALLDALLSQDAPNRAWFDRIETTESVVSRLTSPPIGLDEELVKQRLQGTLIGADGTACLIIALTQAGIEAAGQTIDLVVDQAAAITGYSPRDIHVVGTLFEEVTVDRAADRALRRLVPPSTLAAITVAIIALGRVRESILVFILAGLGQLMSVALIYATGGEFSAVLIVLPTLVFMLSLSTAVHLVNYFHDVAEHHLEHIEARTLLVGLRPCLMASITTIIGMSSLAVSELTPVRQFGCYAAIALGISTLTVLSLFPYLARLLLRVRPNLHDQRSLRIAKLRNAWHFRFARLANFVLSRAWAISLVGCLILLLATLGLSRLQASTKFDRMFSRHSPTIVGMQWVEEHIGPIISIEVLLDFVRDDDYVQRIQWIRTLQQNLQSLPEVGGALSAASFFPDPPTSRGIRGSAARSAFNTQVREHLSEIAEQGWLADSAYINDGSKAPNQSGERWRITCKVSSLQDEDYGHFVALVKSTTEETIARFSDQPGAPTRFEITGLSPVVHEAQLMLLSDLGFSFCMAFVLITPMMMLLTRNVALGLVVMIPNVLPVAIVFGCMGWLGFQLDIASILTASIALGIAVDDTLHFVAWYTKAKRHGTGTREAIRESYTKCGLAMLETTLISCSAMLPFVWSEFLPTGNFALLMTLMLSGAVVGDLVLLPALLAVFDKITKTITKRCIPT